MQPKIKRVYMPKIRTFLSVSLTVLAVVILTKFTLWSRALMHESGLTPITVIRLFFNTGAPLKSLDSRTNILLLGIGGGEHTGADLTDTMMVLSLDVHETKLALISIPRDLWSDSLKDKVNSAYHYGEEKSREAGSRSARKKGGGLTLAKAIVEDAVGLPIHYSIVIDFSGFKEVIDLVGGVTVNVPRTFTDTEFPIEGKENDTCGGNLTFACRYETIHFDAGRQQMDGDRALKYVRSRQSEGEEGSDFARSRRQQEVLVDLKQKLVTPTTWLSVNRAPKLLRAFDAASDTDMNIGEFLTVGKALASIPQERIRRISFENLLFAPPTIWYGRYVLVPRESFDAVHEYIKREMK